MKSTMAGGKLSMGCPPCHGATNKDGQLQRGEQASLAAYFTHKNRELQSKSKVSPNRNVPRNHLPIRSIPPNSTWPCAYSKGLRWPIRTSEYTVSRRMRSMAPPPLSIAPRPFSAGCKSSRKRVAISTSACTSVPNPSPTISPPIPGYRRPSASGGGDERVAMVRSARLYVCSHKTKRFIVALKYDEEETYRYLMASDLTWRTLDIVQGHSLRWLVEVFVQDWKGHEGWAQLTKQPGEEGAHRSVNLSLLVDHALFIHPDQEAQLKNNLPAYTVGA